MPDIDTLKLLNWLESVSLEVKNSFKRDVLGDTAILSPATGIVRLISDIKRDLRYFDFMLDDEWAMPGRPGPFQMRATNRSFGMFDFSDVECNQITEEYLKNLEKRCVQTNVPFYDTDNTGEVFQVGTYTIKKTWLHGRSRNVFRKIDDIIADLMEKSKDGVTALTALITKSKFSDKFGNDIADLIMELCNKYNIHYLELTDKVPFDNNELGYFNNKYYFIPSTTLPYLKHDLSTYQVFEKFRNPVDPFNVITQKDIAILFGISEKKLSKLKTDKPNFNKFLEALGDNRKKFEDILKENKIVW